MRFSTEPGSMLRVPGSRPSTNPEFWREYVCFGVNRQCALLLCFQISALADALQAFQRQADFAPCLDPPVEGYTETAAHGCRSHEEVGSDVTHGCRTVLEPIRRSFGPPVKRHPLGTPAALNNEQLEYLKPVHIRNKLNALGKRLKKRANDDWQNGYDEQDEIIQEWMSQITLRLQVLLDEGFGRGLLFKEGWRY
jgi:hypothetical protein